MQFLWTKDNSFNSKLFYSWLPICSLKDINWQRKRATNPSGHPTSEIFMLRKSLEADYQKQTSSIASCVFGKCVDNWFNCLGEQCTVLCSGQPTCSGRWWRRLMRVWTPTIMMRWCFHVRRSMDRSTSTVRCHGWSAHHSTSTLNTNSSSASMFATVVAEFYVVCWQMHSFIQNQLNTSKFA